MNGAESLVRTLVGGGVNVCFANPGTSEMHFVAALDRVEGMRCVLGLFEGVVTGMADGYYRMTDNPAATLLHLGPGLANGLANIHNANKAMSGMVNIVGDHATYHRQYDAPLTSDIEGLARPSSHWVKTSPDAMGIAADGAEAIAQARMPPGRIATLILPADTAWNEGSGPVAVPPPVKPRAPSPEAVEEAARVLRSGEPALILVTGRALREEGLGARRQDRGEDRRADHRAGLQRPHPARQRAGLGGQNPVCRRSGAEGARRAEARDPGGLEDAGGVFRLSRQAEPVDPGRLPGARAGAARRGPGRGAGDAGGGGRGAQHAGAGRQRAAPDAGHRERSRRRHWAPRSARCCRRTPSSPTRR